MARIPSGELFPTDEPVLPDELIGRGDVIEDLTASLLAATNVVIAGPRRTGKTTVCDAALAKARAAGHYTVQVDLFEIADLAELAEALVARTIANRPAVHRAVHLARRTGRDLLAAAQLNTLMKAGGDLGEEIEIAYQPGLAARDPDRYLDYALRLPQRIAEKDDKRVILFLDEFQDILKLEPDRRDPVALQKRMRAIFQRSRRVSFLFAGSMEHLMKDIFAPTERPFGQFGGFFDLAPIASAAWRDGLGTHFKKDRCTIEAVAAERLIELSEGHPRATMLIAQQAHVAAVSAETRTIDADLVETGYRLAMRRERAKHQQTVDRINHIGSKAINRHALKVARRIAAGSPTYAGASSPTDAQRAVNKLRDAGIIEASESGRGWRIVDPLLRRYLAEMDPAGV